MLETNTIVKENEAERLKRSGEVFLVPFDKIVIDDEFNSTRIDMGDLEELANSIENSGLKNPIILRKQKNEEKYILIHGKRRYKAIEILINRGVEFPGVKAFMTPKSYSLEDCIFDEIILNDGKPYSALEQGFIFKKLLDRGYTVSEISKKTGKNITHINNSVAITGLPKRVINMIAEGSLSGLTAVALSKTVENEDELIRQLETAVDEAPTTATGEKKKVTAKNIATVANLSPLKKLEAVRTALVVNGITTPEYHFFMKLLSRLKAGGSVEDLIELFEIPQE